MPCSSAQNCFYKEYPFALTLALVQDVKAAPLQFYLPQLEPWQEELARRDELSGSVGEVSNTFTCPL